MDLEEIALSAHDKRAVFEPVLRVPTQSRGVVCGDACTVICHVRGAQGCQRKERAR